jgi:hypothetical protein
MKIVGIDYSMTCPALTIRLGGGFLTVTHFLSPTKKAVGGGQSDCLAWVGHPYPEYHSQEGRFHAISSWALSLCMGADLVVIEDYAMGAKGRVFHLGENCGLLKHKLWHNGLTFQVIAPTQLKKFATGKGNADKCAMVEAFNQRTGMDLSSTMGGGKDCGSPVSDVVDSWFLADYGVSIRKTKL